MPDLVLYGIRLLVKQFLGTALDIEVDQSAPESAPGEMRVGQSSQTTS